MIQSVLFNKRYWTQDAAILWLVKHNYNFHKVHETNEYYRFRQKAPVFKTYFTKQLADYPGISLVIGSF